LKKKIWIVGLVVLLSLSLISGCGGGDATNEPNEPETEEKVLVFARGGDAVGLDPANVTDGESFYVTRPVIDTLVDYDVDTTDVIPGLATSWEPLDKDGLIWEFKLREGVNFHDGTPFNAEAVKFNFDRWMDESNPYRHDGEVFEYWGYMFGDSTVKEVRAVDEYTIEIELNNPFAPFINNLAMPCFAISSPDAIKEHGQDYFKNPVGTGAFKFVEWVKDDKIVLEKNPDFWGETAKVDKLVFRAIPDNSARLLELQAGTIDIMIGLSPEDAQIVKDDANLNLLLRPSMNVGYMAMNMMEEPFDNPLVRKAINHAVDKQALIDAFYAGMAKPAKNPIPPSLWGYNDEVVDYEYNPEKAKELLAEAGFPDGFTTELWAMPVARPYMPQPKEIATALQQQLAVVGIETEIVTMDWATYLEKGEYGEHKLYLLGWTGDNGDPDNFLYVLLDQDNAKVGSAGNVAFYKNQSVHDLLVAAQKETDQDKRAKLYEDAQVIINEDAPWVPLVHSTEGIAAKKSVKNFIPHPTGGESTFWMVDIEE